MTQKHCEVCGETDCTGVGIDWTGESTTELPKGLTHTEALRESVKRELLRLTPWMFPVIWVIDRIGHVTGLWCLGL